QAEGILSLKVAEKKICAMTANKLFVVDVANPSRVLLTVMHPSKAFLLDICTFKENGKNFALTASRDKSAMLWDLETGECCASLLGHTRAVSCVAVYQSLCKPTVL